MKKLYILTSSGRILTATKSKKRAEQIHEVISDTDILEVVEDETFKKNIYKVTVNAIRKQAIEVTISNNATSYFNINTFGLTGRPAVYNVIVTADSSDEAKKMAIDLIERYW